MIMVMVIESTMWDDKASMAIVIETRCRWKDGRKKPTIPPAKKGGSISRSALISFGASALALTPKSRPPALKKNMYLHYSPRTTPPSPTSYALAGLWQASKLAVRSQKRSTLPKRFLTRRRATSKQELVFQPYGFVSKESFPPTRSNPNCPASVSS